MNPRSGKLMVQVLFLLLLSDLALSDANNRTPARILAKQTGAAQFEEHVEQPVHRDCNEHHHRLRKRSSDEDLDYEVYQGVVGRPGIDFPIFPRIPQTTFSCRSYGNGYFADLETECQVFHICEEGRKISFLCPNGTIFQQSELTCDWWFKVNCAGSPSYYAESSEILSKARRQRVKPTRHYKGHHHHNKVAEVIPIDKQYKSSERRIDSNENPSVESLDFEDITEDTLDDESNNRSNEASIRLSNKSNNRSSDKLKLARDDLLSDPLPEGRDRHQPNEQELQITAETSSFVKEPRRNSYAGVQKTLSKEREFVADKSRDAQGPKVESFGRNIQRNGFNNRQKTAKRIDENKSRGFYITSKPEINASSTAGRGGYYTSVKPEVYTNRNSLENPTIGDKQIVTPQTEDKITLDTYSTIKPDFFGISSIIKSATTPSTFPGTYSTARRLETTRVTPFYTPTVPSIAKTRPTQPKSYFVSITNLDEPTTLRGAITTDTASPRPAIVARLNNSEIHRFPVYTNGDLKVQIPAVSDEPPRPPTTSTSGPTYLPNHNIAVTPPNIEGSVSRNIKGILQTVGVLKETMKASQDAKLIGPRFGLDIPPSSGPGTLVSLTNYFANGNEKDASASSSEETKETSPTTLDISASLLSNKTSGKYLSLFGLNQNDQNDEPAHDQAPTTSAPEIIQAPTSIADFTRTTIRDLVKDPETRKIAQVFSNAITKYIEDPNKFRATLIDVRPTEPSRTPAGVTEQSVTTPTNFFDNGGTVTVTVVTDSTPSSSNKGTTQSYLPTTTDKYDITTSPSTQSNDIAKEINSQFDFSTPLYDFASTESTEATTYRGSSFSTSRPKASFDLSILSELLPPIEDDEHEHESLHKVQSQSFVKSFNDLAKSPKSISFEKPKNTFDIPAGKGASSQKENNVRTENPWINTTNSQTEAKSSFDTTTDAPLTTTTDTATTTTVTTQNQRYTSKSSQDSWAKPETKNKFDTGAWKVTETEKPENQTSTTNQNSNRIETSTGIATPGPLVQSGKSTENPSVTQNNSKVKPNSSAEKVTTGFPSFQNQNQKLKPTDNPWAQITHSIYIDPLTINDGLMRGDQKATTLKPFDFVNTDRSRFENASEDEDGIDDILNSPELSSELLPQNSGLQRIANKLFGGLNETEALHLKNVMKKAEHNQSVLRLLLLLIQTCDDQNGKALEKSRKILLNALIGMDGRHKSKTNAQLTTTTNKIPITTYRRPFSDTTTTLKTPTTTTDPTSSSSEETTKFEIRVADPEDEEDTTANTTTSNIMSSERQSKGFENPNRTSDERALELLKSLYSLASKFSRR